MTFSQLTYAPATPAHYRLKPAFWVLVCFFSVVARAQSVTERDSLLKRLSTLPNDTNRVMALNALGFQYRQSKPEMTYLLGQQAYELARTLNYPAGEARALATMAAAFKFLGDYAKSLKLYNQAKDINARLNDRDRVAVIINNTADLYIQQGEWQKGLAAMRDCFAIYNTLKKPKASSKSVYLTNLAECLYHSNQLDSANRYLIQALHLAKTEKETALTAIYYLLGDVALAQNKTHQALFSYRQSVQTALRQESYSDLYESYYRLAKLYQKTARQDSSVYFGKLALMYSKRANYLSGILKSSQNLSSLYEGKSDTEALRYFKIAVAAKDSLYSQDKVKRLLSITFEEKEQARQVESEKTAYQNSIRLAVLTGILSVFIGIAFILLRNNRQKQKANRVLQGKNQEIEKTVSQLKTAQVSLAAKNAENELLLKEIHHRVKNNLEIVSSLLALQSAKISDPNVQEAMQASQNRVQSMGIIHQKLYQGEQLAAIEMRDYFMNLSESILNSFDADGRIKVEYPMPELVLDIDTAISIGLITNELLTNSLKYAFVGKETGTVSISLVRPDADSLLLQIADNGIGKIPGMAAQGTGFGTQLVELLTRQLDGILTYENQNGTLVKLRFKRPAIA